MEAQYLLRSEMIREPGKLEISELHGGSSGQRDISLEAQSPPNQSA